VAVWFLQAQSGHGLHRQAARVGKASSLGSTKETPQNGFKRDLSRPTFAYKLSNEPKGFADVGLAC
jgi:hypothetical protein